MERDWIPTRGMPSGMSHEEAMDWTVQHPIVCRRNRVLAVRFVDKNVIWEEGSLMDVLVDIMESSNVDVTAWGIIEEPSFLDSPAIKFSPGRAIVCISEPKDKP